MTTLDRIIPEAAGDFPDLVRPQRPVGGAEGTRTPDPLHAMEVRYQLRHSPVKPRENARVSIPVAAVGSRLGPTPGLPLKPG